MPLPFLNYFNIDFPSWHYYILIYQDVVQSISDHMTVMLVSFLAGVMTLLLLQGFILYGIFKSSPSAPMPKCKEEHKVKLPEFLKSRIHQPNLKHPEDCIWLNFVIQFIFSEMKDSLAVRRFITKKIQMEFEDLLKTKTAVFVDELYLRDFSLGETMPVFTSMSVLNCQVHHDLIEALELKAELDYNGGFQVAIDAALPFGRMAFVSVKVLSLKGTLRLHFTKLPFSHWSMSFYEEPELDLEVVAHLDGRPMSKLKNIIANQIRGLVRKKHTFPNYKIRFKPFFSPRADLETEVDPHLQVDGNDIGNGVLEVTILSASRLPFVPPGSRMYCTVCVDSLPWKQLMAERRKNKKIVTLVLVKTPADPALGMVVKDELLPDRLQPVVIIDEVTPNSPAQQAGVHQNDILLGVSGNKVPSAKIAMKSLKWAKDNKIQIQVERDRPHPLEFLISEPTMARRASSWHSGTSMTNSPTTSSAAPIISISDTAKATTGHPRTDDLTHLDHEDIKDTPSGEKKTLLADASENPAWGQKFLFVVDPSKKFLNVCIWCRGGDRTDKNEILKHSKHDLLIGYVSLSLEDIYLQCLITLNGSVHERFKLKHGHYKTADDLIKMWQTHKGWDPNQMYGDLLLAFTFYPTSMTDEERKSYASCKVPDVESGTHDKKGNKSGGITLPENIHLPDTKLLGKDVHHQFENTTFVSAIFCDYCGKKIWMKDAFKCRTCNMVCHKKCLVKCLLNTICTEHGVRKRSSADNDEPWIPLTESSKHKQKIRFDDKDDLDKDDDASTIVDLDELDDYVSSVQAESFIDSLANKSDAGVTKTTGSDVSVSRFRILKEQTERMKDLMKHLKRGKVQNPLSDKAIVEAKESGARLFLDMDTAKRKEKLEGLIKSLDEQLILEMQNKELIEKECAKLEEADKLNLTPKHRAEFKALEGKAIKSGEKLDAMRLLMLQYCSGLQTCLSVADAMDADQRTDVSQRPTPASSPKFEPPKGARYTVTGFVRRAGTSVKEKVTSIKKDFGRKGKSSEKAADGPSTSAGANNNKQLNQIAEIAFSAEHVTLAEEDVKTSFRRQSSCGDEMGEIFEDILKAIEEPENDSHLPSHHPAIQIKVEDTDRPGKEAGATGDGIDPNEPRLLLREQLSLTRSNSDSGLEICKMLSLSPEEILRYRGNSLPKLLVSDDSDSGSDFLVINSSDEEQVMTDSSDNEQEGVAVNFAGDEKKGKEDDDDNSDAEAEKHHRTTAQQFQTFQV